MFFKKVTTLVLLLVIVSVVMTGCAGNSDDKNNGQTEYKIDDYTSHLAVEDYDGYDFRILVRPNSVTDQYVEEETADIVADAVYKRNKLVEDMYNINIVATESSGSSETDALNTILAGDDAYDLIFPHSSSAFSYAVQKSVVNFNEMDAIHMEKPWWSKDIIDSCNINGNLYVLDGDISTQRLSCSTSMFFNKRIFDDLGLEYPYQMVRDNEWTFEEFSKIVKKGAKDLNGDGVIDFDNDQFGLAAGEWSYGISALYTGGQRIYRKNADGIPMLTVNTSKTVDIYDKFFDLVDSDEVYYQVTGQPMYEGRVEGIFREGRAMFADGTLGNAKNFRAMEDNFGIIPLPKFTDSDKYATNTNGIAHLIVVPITVSDLTRTGNIIEALCAIGSREVIPAFYDVSLKTKFARDDDSEEMIDIIKDSLVYDLGYVSGGTFRYLGQYLSTSQSHDFSSYYASHSSTAALKLKEFNKAYGDIR